MTLAEPVPCPTCGVPFKRINARSKYCSVECRGKAHRAPRGCAGCGRMRAKTDSTYCRDCWLSGSRIVQQQVLAVFADGDEHKMSELIALVASEDIGDGQVMNSVRTLTDIGELERVRKGWYRLPVATETAA
jgi:hypothetical protein